jgi:predicted dehydrogenase
MTLSFGLVGAGAIAQTYAQAFEGWDEGRISAVADLRPDAARALAERLRCESFDDPEAMAGACALDAVVVCTPPRSHRALSTYFLERGVHVLCEKPLSVDLASAAAMVDTAARAGLVLAMASKFRHTTDTVAAKSMVASGVVGDVVLVENAFTSRVDMRARWNADPTISGGGVLIDNGTHSVDLLRHFIGPLVMVLSVEGKRVQELPVEDTVRVFAKSASGVVGGVDLSWSIDKECESYLNVYGSRGSISVGWTQSRYRPSNSREWIRFGNGYDKLQAFRSQLRNFAVAVRGEGPLLVTPEDALASAVAIEAAYRSLREGRWTAVADPATTLWPHPRVAALGRERGR